MSADETQAMPAQPAVEEVELPQDPAANATPPPWRLAFSGLSDVGRVRKENQDSGYAGPWLLAVCDGVGGAVRGDLASSTALAAIRRLDEPPATSPADPDEMIGHLAGALHRAHDRIAELVEADPGLNGTSTTATIALFDGYKLAIGHSGDSRAYLLRGDTLAQITKDHTFVQTLIDEGRITEEEARTHPHRNLILNAIDGIRDADPDLFLLDLELGDRILVCSDGACGVMPEETFAQTLAAGDPAYAAVQLVTEALAHGSTDNVTAMVADVVADDEAATPQLADQSILLVGAAAELPQAAPLSPNGRRAATETTTPNTDDDEETASRSTSRPDPRLVLDPEQARYAPRPPARYLWLRLVMGSLLVIGLLWMGVALAWHWSQQQYFVAEQDGNVAIFRGLNAEIPLLEIHHPYEVSDIALTELSDYDANQVRQGIETVGLDDARQTVLSLSAQRTGA